MAKGGCFCGQIRFDEDVKHEAKDHIFVGEKASYYPICDGLPQYEKGRT